MRRDFESAKKGLSRVVRLAAVLTVLALLGAPGVSAAEILFVHGAGMMKSGEAMLLQRLQNDWGYAVTAASDSGVTADDARDKKLVILSGTVDAGRLGAMFRQVAVPVLCCEFKQLPLLGMTGTRSGVDFGKAGERQAMTIPESANGHSLAAGCQGKVQVSTSPAVMGWGVPGAEAAQIGFLGKSGAQAHQCVLFEYLTGSLMPGGAAPAARIALLLDAKAWEHLTEEGQRLLDNAVALGVRASAGGSGTVVPCLQPADTPCVTCKADQGEHLVTFNNQSADTIWLGVWNFWAGAGVAPPSGGTFNNWRLDAGDSRSYCVPKGSNWRFFPRTGCHDAQSDWNCTANDCGFGHGGATCSDGGVASLAEINFENDAGMAYLDVSYVDGYTYPVTIKVENAGSNCTWQGGTAHVDTAGCAGSLGACPWSLRDSSGKHTAGAAVCYGSVKEASYMRWFSEDGAPSDSEFVAIGCSCPANIYCDNEACGTQAKPVGCGCSPHAKYDSSYQWRTCCSPIADLEGPYVTPCNESLCTWPDKFKAYPRAVKTSCNASYSWQFHDNEGLLVCQKPSQPYNYTLTFWPK